MAKPTRTSSTTAAQLLQLIRANRDRRQAATARAAERAAWATSIAVRLKIPANPSVMPSRAVNPQPSTAERNNVSAPSMRLPSRTNSDVAR